MKNLIKITVISSFLIITCLLISACGSSGDSLVQGKGEVDISTTISGTTTPLAAVTFQVSSSNGGTYFDSGITDANGKVTWIGPIGSIGSDYYFTFTKTGYVTQSYIKRTPNATGPNVKLDVAMVPAI